MEQHNLEIKIFATLLYIEAQINRHYYFNTNTLQNSLSRLFSHYYRIVSVYNLKTTYHGNKEFLDIDLESYIIRHRIIINDIAYIIWQLLDIYNLNVSTNPKGGVHPKNKELSFFDLQKKLNKNTDSRLDGIRGAVNHAAKNFEFLKDQRDNIAHYKSTIMIFGDGPDFEFAIMNPAGTMPVIFNETKTKLVLKNVFKFTNEQQLFLWNWMNGELVDAIALLAQSQGINANASNFHVQLSGYGTVGLFKKINDLQ